ncbi:hypothetical protein B484DRAFT_478338 [Ochromonadaceae sp. CCMP2298]|nr:hypothetical protein B484DRAFT_478338 [Ochromonadaceae sp. CCMP2298]|mmetsp:Transcript_11240/g.24993  ORF Transcript_11240/g.24993 Transcript_11240/m.24993 type:complete len:271 (+) Transcript_11240:39-851(+)
MGSAASTSRDTSRDLLVRKHKSILAMKNIFHVGEPTLNDCLLARASWVNSALSVPNSLFYQHLQNTFSPTSTLLLESASCKRKFLDDLCSILLSGVTSYKTVGNFYHFFKSIPVHEYGVIGETLIKTLMEMLPMHTTGDFTTRNTCTDHTSELADVSTSVTPDRNSTSVKEEKKEEGEEELLIKPYIPFTLTPTDSPQSVIQAWVRLYAKFYRHIIAVSKGRSQPPAHPSMHPHPDPSMQTQGAQGGDYGKVRLRRAISVGGGCWVAKLT